MFTEPPIEDQLAWHTLWPESHKLYGHGNELFSLCCDHQGKLVASSCKVYMVPFLLFRLIRAPINTHQTMLDYIYIGGSFSFFC